MLKYVLSLIAALALGFGASHTITNGDGKPVTEDSPKWDCRAMGNHICGKDLAPNGKWVREVTDKGEMWCWETVDKKGNVYLNLCGDGDQ